MKAFEIRGFNLCESILRHTPEQLRTFIRRMKTLNMNTLIVHYDYGFKRYQNLILEECEKAGVEIILMTFGPRTFLSYSEWKPQWFAKKLDGTPQTERLECDTYPCAFEPEVLKAYEDGARKWLESLPKQIHHVHMRAADNLLFCQCEKCRNLPDHEKWQPFVDIFAKAVQECRPDLKFETDVYVKRYNIPENHEAFEQMDTIMYDTFYRHTFYPLGSREDVINKDLVQHAATEPKPDAETPNEYHEKRLREWATMFPGKVYIHENTMAQSYFGNFQHSTGTYLEDLKLYRELGIKGVCYEAYEPGYAGYAEMFEILARALNGEDVSYVPTQTESNVKKYPMHVFCDNANFPIKNHIVDPIYLKHAELYRKYLLKTTAELYREYVKFAFEHEDILDCIYIGFSMAQRGLHLKQLRFRDLSPKAEDMIHRRKLWDFMEEIPLDEDPREVCRKLIYELAEKAENYEEESIVTLNRDVEHIVNAAARYGAYGYGGPLPKRFAMLVTTDIHRCPRQMSRATEYLDQMEALDVGICLGDIQGSNYAENDGTWYTNIISQAKKPFYTVIGNHDGGHSTRAKVSATKEEVFSKFLLPTREQMGLPELNKTYYAVNFDEYKLALIVLDNYDVPDERDENGDFRFARGVEMIGQAQADWLVETLGKVPEDYHLIIARHHATGVHIATPCNWTQEDITTLGNEKDGFTTYLVQDLVNAWMNGKSMKTEYPSEHMEGIQPIKVEADYTKRGEGHFVGYIVGHRHKDWIGVCKKYPDQKVMCFASSANDDWQNYASDLPRARGTKAEDCITVLSVDTESHFVYLVRVGSNITNQLVERTFYKLSYDMKSV